MRWSILVALLALCSSGHASPFGEVVRGSNPAMLWSFDGGDPALSPERRGPGPVPPEYPEFPGDNRALKLKGGQRIQLPDPGTDSVFDFDRGDEITVEALVNPEKLHEHAVILSKGRTYNEGFSQVNQNWAFRLRSVGGRAGINLLFRSRSVDGKPGDWHRWTSTTGFGVGTGWHHVALSYRFGDPNSIRGYIDGKPVKGKWDMGGPTDAAPVVDDDELWIGSAMKGSIGNSFHGSLDEIALHRRVLSAEEIGKRRFDRVEPPLVLPEPVPGVLRITMHGPFGDNGTFRNDPGEPIAAWEQDAMGFVRIPRKYDDWGIREDWGTGVMVRAVCQVELEAGTHRILGRTRSLSRVFLDGEEILHFAKQRRGGGAHNQVKPVPEVPVPGMRPHAMDDVEKIVTFESPGGVHTIVYDVMVGGPGLRLEFGEACLAIAREGEMFRLVGPSAGPELTDAGWTGFVEKTEQALSQRDRETRQAADRQGPYWEERHRLARLHLLGKEGAASGIDSLIEARLRRAAADGGDPDSFFNSEVRPILSEHCYRCHGEKEKGELNLQRQESLLSGGDSGIPAVVPGKPEESFLMELVHAEAGSDRMPPKGEGLSPDEIAVLEKWISRGGKIEKPPARVRQATPLVDDLTFLRRLWLDTAGMAPPLGVIREFVEDSAPEKRSRMIRRMLDHGRWADNWMGYWQDVLAENPNLLKPNLNNTGPFRYWILEALRDNKPMDRFATELMMMRGSTWGGGTRGFEVASQNDVPMAAKAHIIGTAFLGVDMKCARCHDAPYHETTQKDLFQMAAMLRRQPIKVPKTSSVPANFFEHARSGGRKSLIEVTLDIGALVKPEWPFDEFRAELPDGVLRNGDDTRERFAADVTFTRRFAEVMVNRVWKRFMGAGLVEKVDDWEGRNPSDPALLAYLADEFIRGGYDLKRLTSLILHSRAYQREAVDPPEDLTDADRFFEGPYRRRMTAEQVVDNAWQVSGREMKLGHLTMDIEGRLSPDRFINFGEPRRAWEFSTMANERDRPSLAMPEIQAVVDVLLAFGWRNSRQEPSSHRIEEPNPLQPGVLANGVMGSWLTRLTDDSEVTRMCLEAESADQLTESLFLRYLTRLPTDAERKRFNVLLSDGFERRVLPEEAIPAPPETKRFPYVSWSNHLDSEANSIKQEREELARQGPPPTRFLRPLWREQAEDALWVLLNAPEMIMIP